MKAILVTTEGNVEILDKAWDYFDIRTAINAKYIEAVQFNEDYFAYINEEGKLLELPENKVATELWYNSGQRILLGDWIAGDVLFMGEVDSNGDSTEVPEYLYAELVKLFIKKKVL